MSAHAHSVSHVCENPIEARRTRAPVLHVRSLVRSTSILVILVSLTTYIYSAKYHKCVSSCICMYLKLEHFRNCADTIVCVNE